MILEPSSLESYSIGVLILILAAFLPEAVFYYPAEKK